MRILPLVAAIVLAAASPVMAAPHGLQDPVAAVPTEAELEAAAEAFGQAIEALEVQAAVIRADASLSPEQRQEAIVALVATRQADFDAFLDLLERYIVAEGISDGADPAEAAAAGEAVRQIVASAIVEALVTGQAPSAE